MNWEKQIERVSEHVVKIATPGGEGTGFLAFYNHDKSWCGIATAAHVVGHAEAWQQPIRITHATTATTEFYSTEGRVFLVNHTMDSAVIFCEKRSLKFPDALLSLLPSATKCGLGSEVGWLGYPSIASNTLCFFAGPVSARLDDIGAYLIDGAGIPGISGGPVFRSTNEDGIQIIGCVSAYHAGGQTFPGLLKAQDVSEFQSYADFIKDVDEANRRKAEFDAAQRASAGSAPSTSSSGL